MFNKTIVVALLVCACYLGTIEARPGLTDVATGQIAGSFAQGVLKGTVSQIGSQLPAGLGQQSPLSQLSNLPLGTVTG
ncbi:uncharacterized protein LOC122624560 [Drosophila teissieri]|uniref:uncharacterized protein LOC122624560 n=1 Tax=Drosophila teissieri TaxID=7243 RepID=UPI001CBA41E1|nr:uncharacterized protein LOC122624560 [Drosophila teissieri]